MNAKLAFSSILTLFFINTIYPNHIPVSAQPAADFHDIFCGNNNTKSSEYIFENPENSNVSEDVYLPDLSLNSADRGSIFGIVHDEKDQPLAGANILIIGTDWGGATDYQGMFKIDNVEPGLYKIRASFIGFKSDTLSLTVKSGRKTRVDFKLYPVSFQIGGIEVTAKADLIPTEITTKTDISAAEIEHYQATSLGDVLDLVPGVQKSSNPGLNKTSQIAVRGDESDALSAFGTKVVIDGMPQSNNANMQFEALTGSKFGGNTTGRGIDLRSIPADNLESISVISGLPSVKYGEFTNGIIVLKTKIGSRPNRFKFKNNPNTSEGNFGGGFALGKNAMSYNLNIARSQRDLRLVGDEYTRYTGQLVYSTLAFENRWSANYKLSGQMIYDEEEPRGDLQLTNNYNRGFSVGFNTWGEYHTVDDVSKFDYKAFAKMTRINSRKSRLKNDYVITPGGDTLASYIGVLENKGIQWTLGGELNWEKVFFTGNVIHKFLAGSNIQYDANSGQGVVFDTLFNYYGIDSKRRPYSFDDIPGQTLLSIYAEDKMTGKFIVDYSLRFGFRYDLYRPFDFNIKGLWGDGDLVKSHQGSFFNPRLSLILYFSKSNQLRLSAGKTSKSPPMSAIYPPEDVFSWRNPVDSVVYYFRYDLSVPNLKGYQSTQFEISYDHKLFNKIGASISAYYRERTSQPHGVSHQVFKEVEVNGAPEVFYVDSYNLKENIGIHYNRGIELSLRTSQIKPLNMNFTVIGSYNRETDPGVGIVYDLYPNESWGQYANYHVPGVSVDTLIGWTHSPSSSWEDRLQFNYYIKYTNQTLGLWVTFRAEQLYRTRRQSYNLEPVDHSLLSDEEKEIRAYEESIISRPNKWLFSFSVSKSLFAGAEVSFYVNNFLDDPALYRYYNVSSGTIYEVVRNPDLFYGIEFSMIFDKLF